MRCWKGHRPQGLTVVCHKSIGTRRRAMSKDVTAALTRCLQELRLAAVRSQYEEVARQALAESWSYATFLLEMMQRECQQRQHNRIERLLRASRLPLEKSWA